MLVLRPYLASCWAVFLAAIPSIAWACPNCAQNNGDGNGFLWLMATMILLPFPVAAAAAYFINRCNKQMSVDQENAC